MDELGIRELKAHASEIVRKVQEEQARYVITRHGEPVAMLVPIESMGEQKQTSDDVWEEYLRLGREIAANWKGDESGVDTLSNMRDER